MKKFLTPILAAIATIAIAVCFAACNKSEGDKGDPARMTEVAGEYWVTYMKDDKNSEGYYCEGEESGMCIILNADGTCVFKVDVKVDELNTVAHGTWIARNNTIKYTISNSTTQGTIDGNKLIFETEMDTDYLYIVYTKK